jgi:nitrate/nitrite transporter NarK
MSEPYPTAVPDARVPDVGRPVLEAPVNRLSVAALIAAFLLPLVGIVVGHLALRQIEHTGERGRPVAVAATALAYLITFGATIGIVAYLASLTGVLAS